MEKDLMLLLAVICLSIFVGAEEEKITRTLKHIQIPITCGNKTFHASHFTATRNNPKKGFENDVIHYIVSTKNRPTIIMRHVFTPITVAIDNTTFCKKEGVSLKFSDHANSPQYSGIILSKVFPYNDKDDNIHLSDGDDIYYNDENAMDFFNWTMDFSAVKSDRTVSFTGSSSHEKFVNSKLSFSLDVRDSEGYEEKLPGYPKDANLTQFAFKLKNLPSEMGPFLNVTADNLRYGVEAVFFTVNKVLKETKFELAKSIDDEYSPGVFETWATRFPLTEPAQMAQPQSFIAWKPVAYRGEDPGYENEAFAYLDRYVKHENKKLPNKGSLDNFDGVVPWSIGFSPAATHFALNVTFGQPKDEGYSKTSFLQWSGMVGSGKPPLEVKLSDRAKTIIALGLGGPFVAGFLVAILVGIIRRLRGSNPKTKYEQIN